MAVVLRKNKIPYNKQPPSSVQPLWGSGIGRGLLYASSIPYEICYTRNKGVFKSSYPTGLPTFGAAIGLGKTQITNGGAFGSEYTGLLSPTLPLSALVCFRLDAAQSNFASMLSFGGNAGGGWSIQFNSATTIIFGLNGVAGYQLTGLDALASGKTYYLLISVTGNGGTVSAYLCDDTKKISTSSVSIGTMSTPTASLTVSCLGGTSYSDALKGQVGSFAVWDRAITYTEAVSLLANPYQLWGYEGASKQLGFVQSVSGSTGTTAVGTTAPGTSAVMTTNTGTGSVGAAAPSNALGLIANVGTVAAGTPAPSNSKGITASGGTSGIGAAAPSNALGLIANVGTAAIGSTTLGSSVVVTSSAGTTVVGSFSAGFASLVSGNYSTSTAGNAGVSALLRAFSNTATCHVNSMLGGVGALANLHSLFSIAAAVNDPVAIPSTSGIIPPLQGSTWTSDAGSQTGGWDSVSSPSQPPGWVVVPPT